MKAVHFCPGLAQGDGVFGENKNSEQSLLYNDNLEY
jgi:hypothetical protein